MFWSYSSIVSICFKD